MSENKIIINQNSSFAIELVAYSVEWLIDNTMVNEFKLSSPNKFEGYQRKVDDVHKMRIVKYIEENKFYFTDSITCSIPGGEREKEILKQNKKELFVVDGQHRIAAFEEIKKQNKDLYKQIKDYTIPVVILNNVDINSEIDTFIRINKTGKKVDTSLAYILKNQIKGLYKQDDTAKIDYIVVETAKKLCDEENSDNIWFDKICFEGNPKTHNCFISLNAFLLSERKFIRNLIKRGLLNFDDIEDTKEKYFKLFNEKWDLIENKWNDLFVEDGGYRSILQGPIGFSSLNRYFISEIQTVDNILDITSFVENCINNIHPSITSKYWHKGELFSLYSSESGYKKVSELLKDGIKQEQ